MSRPSALEKIDHSRADAAWGGAALFVDELRHRTRIAAFSSADVA